MPPQPAASVACVARTIASTRTFPTVERRSILPRQCYYGSVMKTNPEARRVLVLTAPYGEGHNRAAEAIIEAMADECPSCEAKLVDYFRMFVNPALTAWTRQAYLRSITLAPASYGVFYRVIGSLKPDSPVRRTIDSAGRRGLARYLKENHFDCVVSLYPIPSGALSYLRLKGVAAAPAVTVVTDYTCHPEWIHHGTDAYVVGSESVARLMAERGVARKTVHELGIPVRGAFSKAAGPAMSVRDGTKHVLVMAGAYGALGGVRDIAESLHGLDDAPEVTFVCGRKNSLAQKLRDLTKEWKPRPRVLGFIENVASEMLAADLIITKAGGITVAEALALGRPLLIYRPIPGQEERNCEFLEEEGAGRAVKTPKDLDAVLGELFAPGETLARMAEAAKRVGRPQAARDTARLVGRLAKVRD